MLLDFFLLKEPILRQIKDGFGNFIERIKNEEHRLSLCDFTLYLLLFAKKISSARQDVGRCIGKRYDSNCQ